MRLFHFIGAATVIFFDTALAVFLLLVTSGKLSFIGPEETSANNEPTEIQFVPAMLIKLAPPSEQSNVIHRKVPALATGPEEGIAVSTQMNPPNNKSSDKESVPPGALEDAKLRKVFDLARAFAEITDNPRIEGLPEGIPEGEVTDAAFVRAGDIYATKLYRIFKELWVVPSLISPKELENLVVKVKVIISPSLNISDYIIIKKSGNSQFDSSVIEVFKKFEKEGRLLPEPPDEIAKKIFDGGLIIRFHGKDYGK